MTAPLEHLGNVALDDLAREAFGDRGFADAGIADVERVVLRPAAQDLHRAVDLGHAADQRIDLAGRAFSLRSTVNCLSADSFLPPSFSVFSSAPSGARGFGRRSRPCRRRG